MSYMVYVYVKEKFTRLIFVWGLKPTDFSEIIHRYFIGMIR